MIFLYFENATFLGRGAYLNFNFLGGWRGNSQARKKCFIPKREKVYATSAIF